MKIFSALLIFSLCVVSHSGFAADKEVPAPAKSDFVKTAEEFSKDFDETSKRHFTMMMSNHNLISVTEQVRESVGLAVSSCAENNPDMKEAITKRKDEFDAAVSPAVKEAEQNINNMMLAQSYAKPKEIKKLFKTMDAERKAKDKEVEKIPVSSKEACENLMKTLDETQGKLVKLLNATLVSLPQVVQGEVEKKQQEEKEKAEAEKKAEEKKEEPAPEGEGKPESKPESQPESKSESKPEDL